MLSEVVDRRASTLLEVETGSPLALGRHDAGSAGVVSLSESKLKPIEIIMACEAGRISIGEWS